MKSISRLSKINKFYFIFILILYYSNHFGQNNISELVDLDTIKAGRFDTGKMWTFEYPPIEYFTEQYNFTPDEEWFTHLRLSALRFADYCSASFVSEDGLIMTNHHCARESITQVNEGGEDLHKNGFIAESFDDERKIPGLYVDQLVLIEDVTEKIKSEADESLNDVDQARQESEIINKLEENYAEETGLKIEITPLYYGAKYSLYGYKRFTDIRLVFAADFQAGSFGGDPDNFTYPRYNLDCAFFRAYDDEGEPLQVNNFLSWSKIDAVDGEPVFIVGNPGSTDRLKTVAQLEFLRDVTYPDLIDFLQELIAAYENFKEANPEREMELNDEILSFHNSLKAYTGMREGLRNPMLMQRKIDFENKFKDAVLSDENRNAKYGNLWAKIGELQTQMKNATEELLVWDINSIDNPEYFYIAQELINIAEELNYPEENRSSIYSEDEMESTLDLLLPDDFDLDYNNELLKNKIDLMYEMLGDNNDYLLQLTNEQKGDEAVNYLLGKSSITSLEKIKALVNSGSEAIMISDDPFINFVLYAQAKGTVLADSIAKITETEEILDQKLGRALFDVYGTSIPPDATFTLRISDGIVQGFPYNGTYAPGITTFYGMYDRYYSFDNIFPWSLHERWIDALNNFDLSTPFNFSSTCDVTGGSSGSPVVNINSEIVGVSFDGNFQGLPGSFIFNSEDNRTISVHSAGMLEAIKNVYKFARLSDELLSGKIN